MDIRICQGERKMFEDNKLLGNFKLDGISPAPRGVPQIEVTFDIDANGILHVSAKDKGTGKEQKISIQGSSGLSKDEIERAKRDAEAHAEEDKKRAEEIDTINQADSLCFSVERQLKDMGDKLPADLKREIEDKVTRLKEAVSKKDITAIKAGKEDLESRLEALYKAAEAAQQSAKKASIASLNRLMRTYLGAKLSLAHGGAYVIGQHVAHERAYEYQQQAHVFR